jgi:hypothetical protein
MRAGELPTAEPLTARPGPTPSPLLARCWDLHQERVAGECITIGQ